MLCPDTDWSMAKLTMSARGGRLKIINTHLLQKNCWVQTLIIRQYHDSFTAVESWVRKV